MSTANTAIFHLSFPVRDIESTQDFYVTGLGCCVGRQSTVAIMLNFYGHQLVAHVADDLGTPQSSIYPRHFGLVAPSEEAWNEWRDGAKNNQLAFFREPHRRFANTPLEHLTFFLKDPSHNILEFKHYLNAEAIFGEQTFSQVGDDREHHTSEA